MQEDISGIMQIAITLIMTAALFTAVFGVSLQSIDFLEVYQRKITVLAPNSAIGDIYNLNKNDKSFASIYKIVQTYPDYVNTLVVDFSELDDSEYSGEDYVCYKLVTTNIISSETIKHAIRECGLEDAGFVNIDNLSSEDSIYGTSDNIVSIGHGSGFIRFQCSVYKCTDGQTFDIYAKCVKGLR